MTESLDLSLPESKIQPGKPPSGKGLYALLALILVAVVTHLVVLLVRTPDSQPRGSAPMSLPAEKQKKLALKLEKQGLNAAAAEAWQEYLAGAGLKAEDKARLWYRIGKLHQEDRAHAEALHSYHRSESFARISGLAPEISRRIQECLEGLGKFAALRYELAERVGVTEDPAAGGEVLAEIGPQKITTSALDRRIETQIDRQLSQFASFLPDEERRRKKEEMLKRFSTSAERRRFLEQFVLEEILYRKAREDGLPKDPAIRVLLADQERSLLAGKLIETELADRIRITPGDVATYYKAHKDEYVSPERAKVSRILVEEAAEAEKAMQRLKQGESFEDLARELSADAGSRHQGGRIPDWIDKGTPIPGLGEHGEAQALIFDTDPGQVAKEPVRTDQGFHILKVREREPERQMTLDEVKAGVFRTLRAHKEREVQEAVLAELRDRYDVVIHQSSPGVRPVDAE